MSSHHPAISLSAETDFSLCRSQLFPNKEGLNENKRIEDFLQEYDTKLHGGFNSTPPFLHKSKGTDMQQFSLTSLNSPHLCVPVFSPSDGSIERHSFAYVCRPWINPKLRWLCSFLAEWTAVSLSFHIFWNREYDLAQWSLGLPGKSSSLCLQIFTQPFLHKFK